MTIAEFIKANNVRMTAERADSNPNMDDFQGDHWKCRIRYNGKSMVIYFSQGYGHNGRTPKIDSVLYCIAADANGYDNAPDFENWASEYGYDTDSRKAYRVFMTVRKQADKLHNMFDSKYDDLLECEE